MRERTKRRHRPGCLSARCDHWADARYRFLHRPRCHWRRTGATLDPTRGQTAYADHGGFSFAELLQAGSNAGMRPDLTQLVRAPRSSYGMRMGASIKIRAVGWHHRSFRVWKNDVGSGQGGDVHFTIDLHPAIASAIGFSGYGDVEVARC